MTALTDTEKTDARRFCGYPAYGSGSSGFESWRFYQKFGLLEYRLNNLSDSELVIIRRYLTTLTGLEFTIPQAAASLDTDQAAVWTRNKSEVADRSRLFDGWRRRLCEFIGIPPGPGLLGNTATLVL